MDQEKTIVSPNIDYITDTLGRMSKGELRVPNFQRPFVWKPEDMISLFESIYRGYPIGSVLYWETDKEMLSLGNVGLHSIPRSEKPSVTYVLDGHQRLSTLYGCLVAPSNLSEKSHEEYWPWFLYFDLEKEEFLHLPKNNPGNHHIPLNRIIKTTDFLKECKRIEQGKNGDVLIDKAEKLAQVIRGYKLTITKIEGGDLDSAVEIFSRLNTKGVSMTNDQMFSALTYKEGPNQFNLSERIDNILEALIYYKFSEIDRIFIFRAILAAAKKDIYKVNLESLVKDSSFDLQSMVSKCEQSILKAAEFLYTDLRVPGDKLLPYNLQLVFLSEFFLNCNAPSDTQLIDLRRWFWVTSYTGWFAGANSSKVKIGLDNIRSFAKGQGYILSNDDFFAKATDIPDRFDFRFARVKVFVLFLLSLSPKPLDASSEEDGKDIFFELGDEGYKAMHQIFKDNNKCSNRLLLGPKKFGHAKRILLNESVSFEVLESHGISSQALESLIQGNEERFHQIRERTLTSLERSFMDDKGVSHSVNFDDIFGDL